MFFSKRKFSTEIMNYALFMNNFQGTNDQILYVYIVPKLFIEFVTFACIALNIYWFPTIILIALILLILSVCSCITAFIYLHNFIDCVRRNWSLRLMFCVLPPTFLYRFERYFIWHKGRHDVASIRAFIWHLVELQVGLYSLSHLLLLHGYSVNVRRFQVSC